jgi:hypothetical protein
MPMWDWGDLDFLVILRIEGCLECCMLFCVLCVILCDVLYFTVLYCPVLHCSTLPPGINTFVVNNNNNNNVQVHPFLTLVLRKWLASCPGHFTTIK